MDRGTHSANVTSAPRPAEDGGTGRKSELLVSCFRSPYAALAITGLLIGSNLQVPLALTSEIAQPTEEMTYNGMTLADFSVEMGLPVDHPYLVALFEQLCMSDVA